MASWLTASEVAYQLTSGPFEDSDDEEDLLEDGSIHSYLPMDRSEGIATVDVAGESEEEDADTSGFSLLPEAAEDLRGGKLALLSP